ncbi:MAG: secondary thiamine-phosphate synthase enzyme YjbQ [Acidobacteriota bacterium]|nr:MAG: secondary thiamine-phosphate synthase enzyme YjbQ [Acidobacteriota bacterium]
MALSIFTDEHESTEFKTRHDCVELRTENRVQFIDITELVRERVRRAGITHGVVNIQTKHTTTAVVLNENEPHLLQDFEERLEAWAPQERDYRHNNLEARRFQRISADEKPNGDAHARALILGASETMNVIASRVELGEWQRLFFVELDGPRPRTVSILAMGISVI